MKITLKTRDNKQIFIDTIKDKFIITNDSNNISLATNDFTLLTNQIINMLFFISDANNMSELLNDYLFLANQIFIFDKRYMIDFLKIYNNSFLNDK